jgi:SAM-dependent methyltransferase
MNYTFKQIDACNMCGNPSSNAKILGKRMNQSQGLKPHKKIGITTTILKCRKCGLVYANPLPLPTSIEQHYGLPPETYWTPEYFKIEKTYFEQQIATFNKLHGSSPSNTRTALDIGAGIGKAMIALKDAGFEVKGFEPSPPFYHKAVDVMKIPLQDITLASMENAEFPENSFDFITFGAVLEHLYDANASILKALKWIKKDGLIHIEVPSSNWLISKLINFSYKIRGFDYVTNISPMHPPFHIYEFGLSSFIENAKNNQYEVAFHKFEVCDTYLPKAINTLVVPYMRKTNTGMQLEIWLRKK